MFDAGDTAIEFSLLDPRLFGAAFWLGFLPTVAAAGLLKLESSPDPPTSRLRPRLASLVRKSSRSRPASTLEICLSLCSNNICGQLKSDRNSTADSDKRVVLQTARDASWQDPLTRLGLSVTPQDEQPEAPTALQDQQWRRMREGIFHQLRAGVERARIVAHHCIHPSRVRSGLRMTRTAPVDPLSHSVGSHVKPLFYCLDDFCGQHCARSFCDWSRMCEMVCRFWFVCHFSVAGLSHEISTRWETCAAVDQSPDYKRPISETIASVLMRRRSLQLLSRRRRFRSFPGFYAVWTFVSTPTVACCSRNIIQNFWNFNDCFRTDSLVVLSSRQQLLRPHQREAVRSAMTVRGRQISSRACRSANCV